MKINKISALLTAILLSYAGYSQVTNTLINGIYTFQKLKVTQESIFQGNVVLDNGLTLSGDAKFLNKIIGEALQVNGVANFAGNVTNAGDLNIAGNLRLTGYTGTTRLVALSADGSLVPAEGPVFNSPASGTITCGDFPAYWESSLNKLVTDSCSQDVKVGIGVRNPLQRLDVRGNAIVSQNLSVGQTTAPTQAIDVKGNVLVRGINGFSTSTSTASILLGDGQHYLKASKNKGVSLGTFGAADGFFLSQLGNVGIGSGLTEPTAKLQISTTSTNVNDKLFLIEGTGGSKLLVTNDGKTYTNEVNVKMGSFPDYVFEKSYSLPSLDEVREYISQNKRLPNMPSATEVAEKGADLGEMNRLLVEKVEQLTLYILELEKRISQVEGNKTGK